ncbi:MAG: hypothetical protein ABFC62_00300 [Clostridiaceae bacterium]|nr:hypothetical protein [Eubacteriales bacterium]
MEETVAGVYRLYAGDISFVGFSRNVRGTLKRLRFELTLNACSFKPLQRFWNERGPLEAELLETLDGAGMDDIALDAHLRACVLKWRRALGENARLVQSEVEA